VLETYKEQKNPLPDLLAKMRINYKSGGFFTIKRVKWDKEGQMFLDYQILIESVADPEQFEILTKLHKKQIEEKDMETVTEWTERALISKHLSGVGRVIQYFNSRTEHEKLNFNDPKQNFIWSVFEGEIKDGIGNGFARIIYGDSGKSYTGYYDEGIKSGKGVQRQKDGSIQSQGIWWNNENILREEVIHSFAENVNAEELEKEMEFELNKAEYLEHQSPLKSENDGGDALLGMRIPDDEGKQRKKVKLIYVPQEDEDMIRERHHQDIEEIQRIQLENEQFIEEMRLLLNQDFNL